MLRSFATMSLILLSTTANAKVVMSGQFPLSLENLTKMSAQLNNFANRDDREKGVEAFFEEKTIRMSCGPRLPLEKYGTGCEVTFIPTPNRADRTITPRIVKAAFLEWLTTEAKKIQETVSQTDPNSAVQPLRFPFPFYGSPSYDMGEKSTFQCSAIGPSNDRRWNCAVHLED